MDAWKHYDFCSKSLGQKKKWNTKAMYPKNVGACAVLLQTDLTSHIITSYSRPT